MTLNDVKSGYNYIRNDRNNTGHFYTATILSDLIGFSSWEFAMLKYNGSNINQAWIGFDYIPNESSEVHRVI